MEAGCAKRAFDGAMIGPGRFEHDTVQRRLREPFDKRFVTSLVMHLWIDHQHRALIDSRRVLRILTTGPAGREKQDQNERAIEANAGDEATSN
jgi:hypothetical protein